MILDKHKLQVYKNDNIILRGHRNVDDGLWEVPIRKTTSTHNQSKSTNAGERAIRTFKNHFLSVLATADLMFLVSEWDRLLPHVELTLNIL